MESSDQISEDHFSFEIAHIGINLPNAQEAKKTAALFSSLFHQKVGKESRSSLYAGDFIELMKAPGRGTHGHIAVATNDIEGAKRWFESQGFLFAEDSIKRNQNGDMTVIYFKDEIAGFAIHLFERENKKE